MQKRKGFTLVELVIVIAVIAILAGVLIGTFASVINKANESARLQAVKAQEIEQKADDILKKIDNSNWYGWEDFETSIVAKLEKTFEQYSSSGATPDQIKTTLVEALNEYAKNHVTDNTSLTEEQVKAIVENAIGTLKFEGVTEAQVRAIVSEATSRTAATQLSAAQVKAIVNAANEYNVTAAQVAQIVAQKMSELDNKYSASETEIKNKIDSVVASITSATLTEEQVAQIVENLLPVTVHVSTAIELQTKAQTLNSFSTIYVDTAISDPVTISTTDTTTLIIKGAALNEVTINAPKATIYLVSDANKVIVEAIAQNSFHVAGAVQTLVVNAGRAVVEGGGSVKNLTAAPDTDSTVKVVIEEKAIVNNLIAEYQTNGTGTNDWIEVENNGTVGKAQLTTVNAWTNDTNTTNVKVTNGANATGTEINDVKTEKTTTVKVLVVDDRNVAGKLYNVVYAQDEVQHLELSDEYKYWIDQYAQSFAGGDGSTDNPYKISNGFELARLAYLVNNNVDNYKGLAYVLVNDIDLSGKCWTPISNGNRKDDKNKMFNGLFDGTNFTITGLTNNGIRLYEDVDVTVNATTPVTAEGEYCYGLFGTVYSATLRNVIFTNVNIETGIGEEINNDIYVGDSVGALAGAARGETSIENIKVNSGSLIGYDATAGILGRIENRPGDGTIKLTMTLCSNSATVTSIRRAGGLIGYLLTKQSYEISECANSGNVVCSGPESDFERGTQGYYTAASFGNLQIQDTNYETSIIGFTNNGTVSIIYSDTVTYVTSYVLGTKTCGGTYKFGYSNNVKLTPTPAAGYTYIDNNNDTYTVVPVN